jgi:hypothetical protein
MLKNNYIVKEADLARNAEEILRKSLQPLPFVESITFEPEPTSLPEGPDFIARLVISQGQRTIIGEVKNQGQPRFARIAVNQLLRLRQRYPDSYQVFFAPFISAESARILEAEGIGYIDLAGNCFLSFDSVFVRIQGNPNPFPQRRDLKSIFSPRSSRVLRVLLNAPVRPWKVEDLKQQAGVSIGLVATVRKVLLDREWAIEGLGGLILSRPRPLLEEWSSIYTYRRNEVFEYYSIQELSLLERSLGNFCRERGITFALTMFSGAARVAPHTRFNRLFAYVDSRIEDVSNEFDLRSVSSGSNVMFLRPYDTGVFYGTKSYDSVPVVSPVQLYLDLNGYKGRGEEAAQFIMTQVLEKIWSQEKTTPEEK